MTKNRRYKATIRAQQRHSGARYLEARRQTLSLDEVMANHPRLTDFGFGVFDERRKSRPEIQRELDSGRSDLRRHEQRVQEVRDWLLQNITAIKTPTQSSYAMKHVVEMATGGYVSNGELIAAALMAGYPIGRPDGPNVLIGMSQRDIDRAKRTDG